MSRVQIKMPETFAFTTRLQVRIGDIVSGGHLGNHILISYLNEAMCLFFRENGFAVHNIEGRSLINADLAIIYKSESMHGDSLKIDIAIDGWGQYGCDFYYRITNERTGLETATAKVAMMFFDYQKRELSPIPESFRLTFEK